MFQIKKKNSFLVAVDFMHFFILQKKTKTKKCGYFSLSIEQKQKILKQKTNYYVSITY